MGRRPVCFHTSVNLITDSSSGAHCIGVEKYYISHGQDSRRTCIIIGIVIELIIPGWEPIKLEHLVCDVNGTLAVDGVLLLGVVRALSNLRDRLQVHLVTADTHGQQELIDRALNLQAVRLHVGNEAEQKREYVRGLGAAGVVAIGQGANDALMLKEAALGTCVHSPEGCAVSTMLNADLVVPDIFAALELFDKPMRIIASLRK